MRLALVLFAASLLRAQSLEITPSAASRGSFGSLLLKLALPDGKEPAALQWEFRFPAEITVKPADIVAGSAAESAGKSLTCAPRQNQKAGTYACILAGNQKPLGSGTIAIVQYQTDKKAAGEVPVEAENALGVSAAGQKIPIRSAKGMITIR